MACGLSVINWTYSKRRPKTISINIEKHYDDVIMGAMASQITSLTIVYSTVYSGADHRKYQSSATLAFAKGFNRGPVNSWPVTRKMLPFDDVIMSWLFLDNMLYMHCRRFIDPSGNGHTRIRDLGVFPKPLWALKSERSYNSIVYQRRFFQCIGKIFCAESQRYHLKFQTKYPTHTFKDAHFIEHWKFKSS